MVHQVEDSECGGKQRFVSPATGTELDGSGSRYSEISFGPCFQQYQALSY